MVGSTVIIVVAESRAQMELLSSAFAHGGWIPRRYTAEGENISPPLHWQGAPPGTQVYALILDDPDAPAGLWIHWVLYDIPASVNALPAGVEHHEQLANGVRQGRCWGVDHFSRHGYQGPQPPPGPPHRYCFQLSALDAPLALPPGSTAATVRQTLGPHQLAQAELTGLFQHHGGR
jgi:Raf kinase inhibitor-like YbhB/YbcL family protein